MAKMNFKVGVSRCSHGQWTHSFGIYLLEADSYLADVPGVDDLDVTEAIGLREDQPGYDEIDSFDKLFDHFQDMEERTCVSRTGSPSWYDD